MKTTQEINIEAQNRFNISKKLNEVKILKETNLRINESRIAQKIETILLENEKTREKEMFESGVMVSFNIKYVLRESNDRIFIKKNNNGTFEIYVENKLQLGIAPKEIDKNKIKENLPAWLNVNDRESIILEIDSKEKIEKIGDVSDSIFYQPELSVYSSDTKEIKEILKELDFTVVNKEVSEVLLTKEEVETEAKIRININQIIMDEKIKAEEENTRNLKRDFDNGLIISVNFKNISMHELNNRNMNVLFHKTKDEEIEINDLKAAINAGFIKSPPKWMSKEDQLSLVTKLTDYYKKLENNESVSHIESKIFSMRESVASNIDSSIRKTI